MHFLKTSKKIFTFLLLLTIFSLVIASCTPRKKLIYLQELEESTITDTTNQKPDYVFRSKDEVYVKISSLDPTTSELFSGGVSKQNLNNSDLALYLNTYTVNDSGFIEIPIVGNIAIANLTINQAQDTIETHLKKYLVDISVTVKLSGFRVTVLGEVKKPGQHISYVSSMNILEAIAISGDLTTYGNREKIWLIRNVDGKEKIYSINLLDRNLINSDLYYLLPNDVIYVEQLGTKTWGFDKFPYDILFTTVSTIVTIYALLK